MSDQDTTPPEPTPERSATSRRAYGSGRLYLRDGVWWMDFSKDGIRVRQSTGERTESRARSVMRRAMQTERPSGPEGTRRATLRTLEERVARVYAQKGNRTGDKVPQCFRPLREFFGNRPLVKITTAALEEYVAWRLAGNGVAPNARRKTVKPATVRNELAMLRFGLRYLWKARELASVPAIPTIRLDNVREFFATDDELARVLAHLPEQLADMVRFCAITGWRMEAEVFTLRWSDVNRASGELRLRAEHSKNGESRTLPFAEDAELVAIIGRAWTRREAVLLTGGAAPSHVFHRDGRPIKSIRGAWQSARRKAGLPHLWKHDLRRTAVHGMERAGVPRSVAMKITGHKTESIYKRYAVSRQDDVRESLKRLAELRRLEAELREKNGTTTAQEGNGLDGPF